MKRLSVALAVFNEASNIDACLSSVLDIADELVVVDGGSTDSTIEIAQKYHAKVILTDNPQIFHINKQKAVDACDSEWILQLDADEIIPNDLKEEIVAVTRDNTRKVNGYYIARKNYFSGHWMKKGGQYPDYVIRLFRKGKGIFPCKTVHEQIKIDGAVGYLIHPMNHFSYKSITEYWRKADSYTSLTAVKLYESGVHPSIDIFVIYTFVKPFVTFFSLYIRHKGILDGWFGLLFAIFSSLHHPIAYRKLLSLSKS